MPKRDLFIHLFLYALLLAVLAKFLPWAVYILAAGGIIFIHVFVADRRKRRRYSTVLESIQNIQGETLPAMEKIDRGDFDRLVFETFKEMASELERKCYQLVEKNIQLLSLKEIGLTIISSLNETKVVESVMSFLSKGLGFKEFFLATHNGDQEAFRFVKYQEALGKTETTSEVLRLQEIDGLLKKSILTRTPLLIKDPDMHPIGDLRGTPLFPNSTMSSYLIVPLLKSTVAQDCLEAEDCLLKRAPRESLQEAGLEFPLDETICPRCERFPVLGLIGVTDGFKAACLSKVDLVSIETLGLQISTILENTQLYTELKKEESFRQNVIDSMMNGLITVDIDGRIRLANEMAEKLSGHSADELIGLSVDELIIDTDLRQGNGPVMRTLRSGRRSFQKEAWLLKRDSSRLPILLNTSFLLDEAKNVQGILAVFLDVTRIKRMEEKIMHLDKLAALGRFSSSIAHEIRNPLTGIAAGIQYLERTGNIPEGQKENVSFILKEVNRIDRLIGDIMNVARVGDLAYQNTCMETIIQDSIASLKELADKKSISIRTEFQQEERELQLDPDRITQVMINLIKNAIEASFAGGEISIRVSFPRDVADVLFDEVGNYAIIEVKDQGVGLTEEQKGKIFEPFFSTKQDGTGLGLYVAHSIIERHGGYIFVESESGKGTVFYVYLPLKRMQHGGAGEIRYPLS